MVPGLIMGQLSTGSLERASLKLPSSEVEDCTVIWPQGHVSREEVHLWIGGQFGPPVRGDSIHKKSFIVLGKV